MESDPGPIINAIERLAVTERIVDVDDVVVLPSGKGVVDLRPILDKRLERPRRAIGISAHTTLESIIAHANRQKLDRSAIFADDNVARPRLVVVYNYDDSPTADELEERPDHRDHRAHYDFPLSEEWQAWTKVAGEDTWLPQAAFAELLEGRILDVLDPGGVPAGTRDVSEKLGLVLANAAALLTCAKGIAIHATQAVTQAVNLSTGETEVSFAEKHEGKGGGKVIVPSAFALRLPVFRGGVAYPVLARLRYRKTDGGIVWGVRLHRADLCFRDAFKEACDRATKETELPLFYGQSE